MLIVMVADGTVDTKGNKYVGKIGQSWVGTCGLVIKLRRRF